MTSGHNITATSAESAPQSIDSPNTGGGDAHAPILWQATLFPRRSLSRVHIRRVVLGLAVLCTLAALRFLVIGAWPVALFVMVDVAAIWFAMHLSLKSGGVQETLTLTHSALQIRRSRPGRGHQAIEESWSFEPTWLKIELVQTDRAMQALEVKTHGQRVRVGAFVTDKERDSLMSDLNSQLARWRAGDHYRS